MLYDLDIEAQAAAKELGYAAGADSNAEYGSAIYGDAGGSRCAGAGAVVTLWQYMDRGDEHDAENG